MQMFVPVRRFVNRDCYYAENIVPTEFFLYTNMLI